MSEDRNGESHPEKEISIWAERYAANRTLPVVVNLVAFLAGFVAMSGLSYLTAYLYIRVSPVAALAGAVPLVAFCGFWLWFSLGGAGRLLPPVTRRLYGGEGEVAAEEVSGTPALAWVAGGLLLAGVLTGVILGVVGVVPIKYMQPVSALYLVPAIALILSSPGMRATSSPFMAIWPALYVLHAGLVVAGAPIQFEGHLATLNMLIPVVGYGLIAALSGHIYSRYALRRLKEAARDEDGGADERA